MTCKDCMHYGVCKFHGMNVDGTKLRKEFCGCFESKTPLSEEEWKLLFGALGVAHGAYWNKASEWWKESTQAYAMGNRGAASHHEAFACADDKMVSEIACLSKKLQKLKERIDKE